MADEAKEYIPVTCSHCEGEGCTYCDKKGSVLVEKPARKCRHCEGVGCFYCGYTGWRGLYVEKLQGKYRCSGD